MDEDRIGLVLAKTSELRSKIVNCIHKTASNVEKEGKESESKNLKQAQMQKINMILRKKQRVFSISEMPLNPSRASCLLCSPGASLRLSMKFSVICSKYVGALQQQQWYEKEVALAEIEYSQKKLLKELKEYKGKDLEVIHEAIAFAGETEDSNDLLLPPYPSRPSLSVVSDNGYLSNFTSTRKFHQNGAIAGGLKNLLDVPKDLQKSETSHRQSGPSSPFQRVKVLISTAAKVAVTIAGVVTILSLAGFEPRMRKRDNQLKLADLFQLQRNNEKGATVECPAGKVPVKENGEIRCVVKERVEIPFESVVATPDVSYGCG
ncbi:UNVERIFIED_CONTAM: Plastid division protein PDV2 [Sesamum calycinum]|uniref:Plastid division protein PDV2 n=1 Tax=Sesamum calycinum TaxID=2727403 RepID=A0AAW2PPC2_9LAMI